MHVTVLLLITLFIMLYWRKRIRRRKVHNSDLNSFCVTSRINKLIQKVKDRYSKATAFRLIWKLCESHRKDGICKIPTPIKPTICLFKPETVEPVLRSRISVNKGIESYFLKPWVEDSFYLRKGESWRKQRKLLATAFHSRVLEGYVSVFNEKAHVLSNKIWESMTTNEFIDIFPLASHCSMDVIFETAMGKKINYQEADNHPHIQALHQIFNSIMKRVIFFWLRSDFIFYKTEAGKEYRKSAKIMDDFAHQAVVEREEKISRLKMKTPNQSRKHDHLEEELTPKIQNRLGVLDLLLHARKQNPAITYEYIVNELNGFAFAAHDTMSAHISWTLYILGLHPGIQRRVYDEIVDVLGYDESNIITVEDIKNLKYLDCVIKESLRLFPPAWFINRTAEENMEINGYKIPKGTNLWIFIFALHRDPEVFPNPNAFDPDRFKHVNSVGRHPYAFIPFLAGPRDCLGKKFALMESPILLATVLRRFQVRSMLPMKNIRFAPDVTLLPKNGLFINFRLR